MNYQLLGKYVLTGQIYCVTGLHIGGTTTGVEIGGLDNPVIKDPLTDQPYVPGSGMKGKLRSLTEWSFGLIERHQKHQNTFAAYDCHELEDKPAPVSGDARFERYNKALRLGRLFGAANDKADVRVATGPTRLIVRDAFLTEQSCKALEMALGSGFYTEVKTENALDRVTSAANPRPIERVPAGSAFDLTMILDIYTPEDHELFLDLFAAMRLLEYSSLGGSGSRGHGQVRFTNLDITWRSLDHYRNGAPEQQVVLPGSTLDQIIKDQVKISWPG